ncbi:MAG: hypothetical protein KJO31_12280 [Gammaproteobacteria bacterium]|nr:hypothetical protein [Gammaproteobacteria bacterium]
MKKSKSITRSMFAAWLAVLLAGTQPLATAETSLLNDAARDWNFRVYLDNKAIGYHNFSLARDDEQKTLLTEAQFDVKFLFVTVYRYRHRNAETWDGRCLQSIDAKTNANGDRFVVQGRQVDDEFALTTEEAKQIPSDCVMTFAYWDPTFLDQQYLLNSQTGSYTPVDVEPLGEDTLNVKGSEVVADRYRIRTENAEVEVWYSKQQEWVGLQSTTKEGRKIRYELV